MSLTEAKALVLCTRSEKSPPDAAAEAHKQYLDALGSRLLSHEQLSEGGHRIDLLRYAEGAAVALSLTEGAPFYREGFWSSCEAWDSSPMLARRPVFSPEKMPAIRMVAMPADLNPGGSIFGGWLLAQMDQAAGIAAWRHTAGRCASVALSMTFDGVIRPGDDVTIFAEIEATGRTSLRIGADAWSRARSEAEVRLVGRGVFTFVALDESGRPRPVA